jgi:hypothetical protein
MRTSDRSAGLPMAAATAPEPSPAAIFHEMGSGDPSGRLSLSCSLNTRNRPSRALPYTTCRVTAAE